MADADRLEVWKFRLEIVKTIIGGFLTVAVFLLGYFLQHRDQAQADRERKEELKQAQEIEHKKSVVTERFKRYEEIAPLLNDVYCYFEYVGTWKQFTPKEIIEHKRKLDSYVYSYSVLFDPEFLGAYRRFIDETFSPYQRWPHDAALRTFPNRPQDTPSKGVLFTREDRRPYIYDAYWQLEKQVAKELDSDLTTSNSAEERQKVLDHVVPAS